MNEDNVEAPPMSDPPQAEVSKKQKETAAPIDDTSLVVSACTTMLQHGTTIVRDLVMFAGLDRISEISYERYNAGLIFVICEHWQPETNTFYFSLGEMTLSLDDVQHLIGLSADGDVPITEGAASRIDGKQFTGYTTLLEMEVNVELPNVCEREQYLMLRDENKALVEQILALKEEVQMLKDQKKTLNDVVHEQYIKSFEELPAKLEKKTKECEALNEKNTKLVKDLRLQAAVDDCNTSLSRELAKKRREYKLLQYINAKLAEQLERQHPELVPIIASNHRWRAKYKFDTAIHDKKIETLRSQLIIVEEMKKTLEVEHYKWEACRQAMKKEFHGGELAEQDDPTFIKLFDQYDRLCTIAQQGPKGDYQGDFIVTGGNQGKIMKVRRANVVLKKKINKTLFQLYVKYHLDVRGVQGEDDNSAFRVPATIKHQSQNQFKKVINMFESLMTKDSAFWKTVFNQSLNTRFSSLGEKVYEQLRRACSYGG
ncbi:hypothetical protein GIB67_021328 [Kingdonia uniflora]|uniref:Aminotransferase-like plant mobile domain-containing protein n=1 Tax=Kingdonia uniflora TaxID=39325 RepID=A0A7J7LY39_9MAGN|nr:hypothetical protein GIB67_021328 [Kingdonia uniflora]